MEPTAYIRFVLALILVIGLILGLSWFMKRLGFGVGATGPLTRKRRLRAVESTMLDGRHRVYLVRRDDVEHLVLVGPNTSQVIERGIPAPANTDTPAGDVAATSPFRKLLAKDEPQ
jgi:flagellar protein FliO/FliZ